MTSLIQAAGYKMSVLTVVFFRLSNVDFYAVIIIIIILQRGTRNRLKKTSMFTSFIILS